MSMTLQTVADATDYIQAIAGPLLDTAVRDALRIDYHVLHDEHIFIVQVPEPSVRYLVGRRGETANAMRKLLRSWCGVRRLGLLVDVRVRPLDGATHST